MFKIGLICGGPSLERGVSLNSARSLLDHLQSKNNEIIPLYVDVNLNFYAILQSQLYSNTPLDFDFKLDSIAKKLCQSELINLLRSLDIVFPAIHGFFGEDGQLQRFLEDIKVPYVGSSADSCQRMFNKFNARQKLSEHGLATFPALHITKITSETLQTIDKFFSLHSICKAVVKPCRGGSSIGVYVINNAVEAAQRAAFVLANFDDEVIIEPFLTGQEFTVTVLQNQLQQPVALIPTQIDLEYNENQIFDYRKKYLPTNQVVYKLIPDFSLETINVIRRDAEKIFNLFEMRDFVRLDGWVLKSGEVCFSDINPVAGMEQNSFLFRQAAILGLSHEQTLTSILKSACLRAGLNMPCENILPINQKEKVFILFGNGNSERQVSLMSGINVWLKLMKSSTIEPIACFLDKMHEVWQLPYHFTLSHTVEEIYSDCIQQKYDVSLVNELIQSICQKLGISAAKLKDFHPRSLSQFCDYVKELKGSVFIALHGAEGEDGTIQNLFESRKITYNGSGKKTCEICMNKFLTNEFIAKLRVPSVVSLPQTVVTLSEINAELFESIEKQWQELTLKLKSDKLIIKPLSDGCSTGVICLQDATEYESYLKVVFSKTGFAPPNTFKSQSSFVYIPTSNDIKSLLLEPYIETDKLEIHQGILNHEVKLGWLELTVAVLEEEGAYSALSPSITVSEGSVLTLEEKFQAGTGINITPPPKWLVDEPDLKNIKEKVAFIAAALEIIDYARFDLFYNHLTKEIIIIEVNTLPALTPSTVLYHQALVEKVSIPPHQLVEKFALKIVAKKDKLTK